MADYLSDLHSGTFHGNEPPFTSNYKLLKLLPVSGADFLSKCHTHDNVSKIILPTIQRWWVRNSTHTIPWVERGSQNFEYLTRVSLVQLNSCFQLIPSVFWLLIFSYVPCEFGDSVVYIPESISGSHLSRPSPRLLSQRLPIHRQPVGGVVIVPKGLKTMLDHLVLSIGWKSPQ